MATWTDTFTITPANPALIGQPGTYTFSLELDVLRATFRRRGGNVGNPALCGAGCASVGVTFDLQYDGNVIAHGTLFDSNDDFYDSQTGDSPSATYSYSVPIVFGSPQDMTVQLTLETGLEWNGITEVLDENGDPVTYSVSSDSATDWSQPVSVVPEPGVLPVLATGVALIARSRRRSG